MDENQIGPNMNTTRVQRYVKMGHTLVPTALPVQLVGPGLKPQCS